MSLSFQFKMQTKELTVIVKETKIEIYTRVYTGGEAYEYTGIRSYLY